MKNKLAFIVMAFSLMTFLHLGFPATEVHAATEGYDLSKIKSTSENVDLDSLGSMAKEYSIPILVIAVVLTGFLALVGLVWKPAKAAAGGLLGVGLVFFIVVNYAPQLTGVMISIVEGVMNRAFGG